MCKIRDLFNTLEVMNKNGEVLLTINRLLSVMQGVNKSQNQLMRQINDYCAPLTCHGVMNGDQSY